MFAVEETIEGMGVNKNDWAQIDQKIAAGLDALKPRGWKRAAFVLRELGPLATIIGAVVALLGITIGALIQSFGHLEKETTFRTETGIKLEVINGTLKGIQTELASLRTLNSSGEPTKPQNQSAAKGVLAEARQKSLTLPAGIIEQAGNRFIEAAQTDQGAWGVALDFVSYRSSLNTPLRPASTTPLTAEPGYYRPGPPIPGKTLPVFYSPARGLPAEEAARYEDLGEELNSGVRTGHAFLVSRGGAASLDGKRIRNVIFDGVEIHYSGKPMILENVIFINCKFLVTNTAPSRRFGETVLASSRVTFQG